MFTGYVLSFCMRYSRSSVIEIFFSVAVFGCYSLEKGLKFETVYSTFCSSFIIDNS